MIIVLVVALPSIVTESIFGLNGTQPDPNATLESSYTEMAAAVSSAIEAGYDQSLARVEEIILDGGYDYDLSIENDISRVDIYVSDHNYALRLGRFKTTAYIYRLGR